MANVKITELTAYTNPASTDVVPIVDLVNDQTKKVTIADLLENAGAGSASAAAFAFDGDGDTGMYRSAENTLAFATGGTGRLFIDSNGNVGIGVSSITNVANRSQLVIGGTDGGLIDLSHGSTAAEGRIFVNDGELALLAAESDGEIKFQTGGSNERFRIDSSGRLLAGTSSARTDLILGTRGGRVQIEAASSTAADAIDNSSLCLTMGTSGSAESGGSANIFFTRTKSDSLGGVTSVANNDILGGLYFQGTDGTDAVSAALIKAEVDGTPGANDMPGRIVLATTADGASSPTTRMTITSSGQIQVSNSGTAAAPAVSVGTTDNGIYSPGTDQVAISTGGSGRLFVDASGNVKIGGTSSVDTDGLSIETTQTAGGLNIISPNNGRGDIFFGDADDKNVGQIRYSHVNDSFTIRTNASDRFVIDSSGRLLVGTSSTSSNAGVVIQGASGGSDGILKLASDNATPADGEALGNLTFSASNHSSSARIITRRDGGTWTAGSSEPTRLEFSTTADGASSPTERIRITSEGYVFVDNSSMPLQNSINTTNTGLKVVSTTNTTDSKIECFSTVTATRYGIVFSNPNGIVGSISTNGSATAYNTSSDHRLKENVVDINDGITRVKQLAPKRFNFIADADTTVDGFLAHEAQAVVPEAVTGTKDEVDDDGNAVMQNIDQSKLVPLLTAALQEAVAKIETLETSNADLLARVSALEAS